MATLGYLPRIAGRICGNVWHNVNAPLNMTPLAQPNAHGQSRHGGTALAAPGQSPLTLGCACRNIGHDVNAPLTRVYATPLAQPMHTDSADMVALLSLRLAREGGLSSWASSVSVHNELLRLGRKVPLLLSVCLKEGLMLCACASWLKVALYECQERLHQRPQRAPAPRPQGAPSPPLGLLTQIITEQRMLCCSLRIFLGFAEVFL